MLLLEREAGRMGPLQTKTKKVRRWSEGHIFLKSHFLALKDSNELKPVKARLPISRSIVPLERNKVFKCNSIGSYYKLFQCYMSHSQMLGKFEYGLPAKF